MYGTIAKIHTNPAQVDALRALAERMGTAPGQLGRLVYQMDGDPGELFLVALFESRQAYWDNAQSTEQAARYAEMSAFFTAPPEWHDGAIIDAQIGAAIQVVDKAAP